MSETEETFDEHIKSCSSVSSNEQKASETELEPMRFTICPGKMAACHTPSVRVWVKCEPADRRTGKLRTKSCGP